MPRKPNTLLRVLVPAAVAAIGVGIVATVFINANKNQRNQAAQPAPDQANAQTTDQAGDQHQPDAPERDEPIASETSSEPDATQPESVASAEPETASNPTMSAPDVTPQRPMPTTGDATLAGLVAETFPDAALEPIGDLERGKGDRMRIEFSGYGAGIKSIRLANSFYDVDALTRERKNPGSATPEDHIQIQGERIEGSSIVAPFMALWLEVNGPDNLVPLTRREGQPVWRQTAPGQFEAFVLDAEGERILRITRAYLLQTGKNDLVLEQHVENLTESDVSVRLVTFGPIDLPIAGSHDASAGGVYNRDTRRVRFGYLASPETDPTQSFVEASDYLIARRKALGKRDKQTKLYQTTDVMWPNQASERKDRSLVWTAMTNRYFGVAAHPLPTGDDKRFESVERVDRVLLDDATGAPMVLRLTGAPYQIEPHQTLDLSIGVYAGQLSRRAIRAETYGKSLNLDHLVVYNFGGPCGVCTFPILTDAILWTLLTIHGIVGDWALSIILLVVVVRSCLHPITRWSQIRLQVFSKQMSGMAPKQQKIREKFADDPKRMQQETAALWREEGINPAGALGCLPMFLQTPVWIALYATLFFSIELRHNPAFYGVFQEFNGWGFLADLARPDDAIDFHHTYNIPLISNIIGPISSINVLPLLLGFVFFAHQKYLTPPPTTTMSPEQQQQQKIIKVMMVVMFPVMMYNAPSGLALYFITNSTLGIIESRWIRNSAEAKGLLDIDKIKARKAAKKAHKPTGGFFARLQAMAEEQQRRRESLKRNPNQPAPGQGKRSQQRQTRSTKPGPDRKYKKRK